VKQCVPYRLCPRGGAAGAGGTSVRRRRPARPGGGGRVPAAAAGEPASRRLHPGAGEGVPARREPRPALLPPEGQTHLPPTGRRPILSLYELIIKKYRLISVYE